MVSNLGKGILKVKWAIDKNPLVIYYIYIYGDDILPKLYRDYNKPL